MLKLHWNEATYREESAALRTLAATMDDSLVVGVDLATPAHAAVDVLQARRRGTPVVVYCAASDPLETMLARVGSQIAASPDAGQRLAHLSALRDGHLTVGGVPLVTSAPMQRETVIAAHFICSMADVVAVFTPGETARWASALRKPIRHMRYVDAQPIEAAPRTSAGVTVYAPSTPRAMLGFIDAALKLHERDATYISAENSGRVPETPVVIAPEWWRPARALSLAKSGFRVVAPARNAVASRVRAFEYADFSADALAAAIDAAFSAPHVEPLWEAYNAAAPQTARLIARAQSPLVSIIVRTYDRPGLLARALDSIVRQTYAAVEIVVVNNGGPDVRHVVEQSCADRPFRYVAHSERSTIGTASNIGARAATGAYIGYLDDDDVLYPDHVQLAIEALERSGADLAYSDCVGEYAVVEAGRKSVLGVGIYLDRDFDRAALYATNFAPIHSIVHRRDVFERFGYFDEQLPVTDDWDMWLRVAHGGRFTHVGRPTCEYSWRIDPTIGNMTIRHQQDFVDCYKRITQRWAEQVAGREDIRQLQAQTLEMQESRVAKLSAEPASASALLLGPLLQNAIPVRGLLDEALAPSL